MAERWIARQGIVVMQHGQPAVRFSSTCTRSRQCGAGCCGMVSPSRQLPAGLIGLTGVMGGGERVEVQLASASLTRVALVCFAVPLAALLAGAWIGVQLAAALALDTETLSILVGLGALALALALVSRQGALLVGTLKIVARVSEGRPSREQRTHT